MNPLNSMQPKFEPSPFAIVSDVSNMIEAQKKLQEMIKQPQLYRRVPKIPIRTPFPSTTMIIGKIGSGKSTRLKRFGEQFHEEGMVVLDLCDFGSMESACYALPNKSGEVWGNFNAVMTAVGRPSIEFVGRAYPTICYVPATKGLPSKLPDFFRPFRIVWQTLEFSEFITLCGFQSGDVAVELLDLAWTTRPKGETFEEFVKRAIEMCAYGKLNVTLKGSRTMGVPTAEKRSFPPLLRRLKTLWDLNILCDEGDPLALDMHAMMMDKGHIHSFTVGYIEDRIDVPFLVYGYLIRRLYNLRKNPNNKYPPMALLIREAQKLAPYQIEFMGQELSRACLRAVSRECRHLNLWVYMDTQDQMSIDWEVRRKVYSWYIYLSDKLVVDLLRKLFFIPDTVAYAIPKLPIGFCAVYYRTYIGVPVIYLPPLSHVKAYSEKFLELWQQEHHGERWKIWDIPFPNSDDVISFEIPEAEEVESSKDRFFIKYIQIIGGMFKLTGKVEIPVRQVAEALGLSYERFLNGIQVTPEFKKLFEVKKTMVRPKESL